MTVKEVLLKRMLPEISPLSSFPKPIQEVTFQVRQFRWNRTARKQRKHPRPAVGLFATVTESNM